MRPLSLYIENFMNHRQSEIDLSQFQTALIVAKDKSNENISNAVGKTTIFSAIQFALYGKVPTTHVKKVIRQGQPFCKVIFEFELQKQVFRVERTRSEKGRADLVLRKKENGSWVRFSDTRTPEAEKTLINLIKLSYKAFTHSCKFAQQDLTGLGSAKNQEDRLKILQEPLILTDYTKLAKQASTHKVPVSKELETISSNIQMLGDPSTTKKVAKSELEQAENNINAKENSIVTKTNEINQTQNQLMQNLMIKSPNLKNKNKIYKIK
jgi:DNA repair exonuclease SbcCD ATPase subunit